MRLFFFDIGCLTVRKVGEKPILFSYLDSIGLLEGAAGVAAVLYTLSEMDSHDMPAWDRVFGLS